MDSSNKQSEDDKRPPAIVVNNPLFPAMHVDIPQGWYRLAEQFLDEASKLPDIQSGLVKVQRIYESDGVMSICFYYPPGHVPYENIKGLYDIETQYEKDSFRTCQVCGHPGRNYLGGKGWIIRCDEHKDPSAIDIKALFQGIPTDGIFTKKALRLKYPFVPAMEFKNGWLALFDRLLKLMVEAGFDPERERIFQVKEKFASLNVYVDIDSNQHRRWRILRALIDEAQNISSVTCEECGRPGRLWVNRGWWLVACAHHKPASAVTIAEHYKGRENDD